MYEIFKEIIPFIIIILLLLIDMVLFIKFKKKKYAKIISIIISIIFLVLFFVFLNEYTICEENRSKGGWFNFSGFDCIRDAIITIATPIACIITLIISFFINKKSN